MRYPQNWNELTNEQQRVYVAKQIVIQQKKLDETLDLSRRLGRTNSPIKVELRPDEIGLKEPVIVMQNAKEDTDSI